MDFQIHGFDMLGNMFQRFSRNGYVAIPFSKCMALLTQYLGYCRWPIFPVNNRNLPTTGTCSNKIDCYGNGTSCQDMSTRAECLYNCPNGMDEGKPDPVFGTFRAAVASFSGCMEGYFKCFCTCLPLGRECVDPSKGYRTNVQEDDVHLAASSGLVKMCAQTDTTLLTCVESIPGRKQTCTPIKWAGDGETDCMNNSDEGT